MVIGAILPLWYGCSGTGLDDGGALAPPPVLQDPAGKRLRAFFAGVEVSEGARAALAAPKTTPQCVCAATGTTTNVGLTESTGPKALLGSISRAFDAWWDPETVSAQGQCTGHWQSLYSVLCGCSSYIQICQSTGGSYYTGCMTVDDQCGTCGATINHVLCSN